MRSLARSLLVALLAIIACLTVVPIAFAAVAVVVQETPTLPPEIPAAYLWLVSTVTAAVFGAVKWASAKVRALPDWAKMVLALVIPFGWKYIVTAAGALGLPLPETIAGLENVNNVLLLVGGAMAMGIRAAFKALFPGLSAAVKSLA